MTWADGNNVTSSALNNQEVSALSATGRLSTDTLGAASGNTITVPVGQDFVAQSVDSGGAVYDVRAWGAGDSEDAGPAIASAISAWQNTGGVLLFPSGKTFALGSPVTISPSQNRQNLTVLGYGSTLSSIFTNAQPMMAIVADGSNRLDNFKLKGLNLVGGSSESGGIVMHADAAASGVGPIAFWTLQDLAVTSIKSGHGITIVGNVFEGQIQNSFVQLHSDNTQSSCITASLGTLNVGNLPSSLEFVNVQCRKGLHCVHADNVDLDMFGGTYLLAQNEGVKINNARGNVFSGLHVESNGLAGGDVAGLNVSGNAEIIGIRGQASEGSQTYGVRVFVSAGVYTTIVGGFTFLGGSQSTHAIVQTNAAGNVVLVGQDKYDVVGSPNITFIGDTVQTSGATLRLAEAGTGGGLAGDAAGVAGDIAWGSSSGVSYLYVCTSASSWMRATLNPF